MKKRIIACMLSICMVFASGSFSYAAEQVSGNSVEASQDECLTGYIPMEDEIPEVDISDAQVMALDDEISPEGAGELPSMYRSDQQSGLPSLKQQKYEDCWAFSAIGVCEASLLAKGIERTSVDLSESHLVHYFYNKSATVGDLLGNIVGDYNRAVGATAFKRGGNSALSMWHLASWAGPVSESDSAYQYSNAAQLSETADNTTQQVFGNVAAHMQNCMIIPLLYRDDVKRAIMSNGAVGASYYASTTGIGDNFYNGKYSDDEGCYYWPESRTSNHAVQLVGWDDAYPATNFVENPGVNGAWLVKNSWGEETQKLAQNGYFWISYADPTLMGAYVFDCESPNNYDHIYQYDGASAGGYVSVARAANVFTASDSMGEVLRAVSIGLYDSGVDYTVDIYTYGSGAVTNPLAGTRVHSQSGSTKYPGYYTIPLEKEISLSPGQKFGVVFTFGDLTRVYIDMTTAAKSGSQIWALFTTDQSVGQSFGWASQAGSAIDMAIQTTPKTARIKAFTDQAGEAAITLNRSSLVMKPGQQQTLQAVTGVVSSWKSLDESVATVEDGLVTATGYGETVVSALSPSGKQASCIVKVTDGMPIIAPGTPTPTPTKTPVVTTAPGKASISKAKSYKSGVKITIKKRSDADGYVIYRSTKKSSKGKKIATLKGKTKTSYVDKKVRNKPGTYYYRVRAYKITSTGSKKYGSYSGVKKVYVK